MSELGAIFYRGPSLLTGDQIVGVVTGLEGGSHNQKTGPMAQAWILRPDVPPMDAKRQNLDDAICGDCKLKGEGGVGATCYVTVWLGPHNVYKRIDDYHEATWPELQALLEGRSIRLGAYGDPAAIPVEVWRALLTTASGWVAYTHQWRVCDQRFRVFCMASVDTEREAGQAWALGWRTFRVRATADRLLTPATFDTRPPFVTLNDQLAEFVCPASDEASHRTTCSVCQLCRGTSSPARSVAIVAHGKPGNLTAFYRSRGEAVPSSPALRPGVLAQWTEDGWTEQPCAGCQKPILAKGQKTRCPDCLLAAQRERHRPALERHRSEVPA